MTTGTELTQYDAACYALVRARKTDEVRKIRDKATALLTYARLAKNRELELDAAEIRIRAERRLGELIAAQKASVGLNKGSRGTGRPKIGGTKAEPPKPAPPTLAEAGIDKKLSAKSQKLASIPERQFEKRVEEWRANVEQNGDRVTAALTTKAPASVHHTSETAEHYTPQVILDAVSLVFGAIPDLDPCSNSHEKPNVQARRHFIEADNGLMQPWSGTVFLNPPYGREIGSWIHKLREEWNRLALTAVLALLPARTDTAWFEELTQQTGDVVVCFLKGRLTFVGNSDPAPFPSMVVYFGAYHNRFARVFHDKGSLWQRSPAPLEWFVDHTEED